MIQRVYEQACKVFHHVVVATDDERISSAVINFGGQAVMTSAAHKSGTERCAEALGHAEKLYSSVFDIIVNIQGDEPFIQPAQLTLIESCFSDHRIQIATLARPAHNIEEIFDPHKPKVVLNKNNEAIYFSRSAIPYLRETQQDEWHNHHSFLLHIGLYAFRREILSDIVKLETTPLEKAESLEQLRWIENGYRILVKLTDYESFGIDTPEDLAKAVKMLGR